MKPAFKFKTATKFKMVAAILGMVLGPFSQCKAETGLVYVPLGYCQLTSLSAASKLSACSGGIPAGATMALISVEGEAIRYRDDAMAPTASVGMPLVPGQAFQYSGTLSKIQFIEQTSGASIDVLFYK